MVSLSLADIRDGPAGPFNYERHRPEETLLYQIIEEHWPLFQQHLEQQGRYLPGYVIQEFEAFLACGRLDRGFLRVQCESCHAERLAWAAPWFFLQTTWILSVMWRSMYGGGRPVDSAAHLGGPIWLMKYFQNAQFVSGS